MKSERESPKPAPSLIDRKQVQNDKMNGICARTLKQYIDERGFPKPIKIGRRHWWSAEQVDDWIWRELKKDSAEIAA